MAKPVRVFQCESCGEVFDPSSQDARAGCHGVTIAFTNSRGEEEPELEQCGPITERVLADPAEVRRETAALRERASNLCFVVRDAVKRGIIDSRSAIADAALLVEPYLADATGEEK